MSSLVRARGSRLRQGSVAAKYFRGRAIALATAARAERGWFKRNHDRGDQKPGIDRPSSFYVKFKEEGASVQCRRCELPPRRRLRAARKLSCKTCPGR